MAKKLKVNTVLSEKSDNFIEKINSEMYYQSDFSSDSFDFNWVDEIEFACPYLDNIVTNPKVALIKEEDVVKIEKAKKVSVASIKNLSKNTHFIDKIDEETEEVQPSKLLIERTEETFNTYENRFLFTLVYNLSRFIMLKEKELNSIEIKDEKSLEYAATTNTGKERVYVELKITSNQLPDNESDGSKTIEERINEVKEKIDLIKRFIYGWQKSEMYTSLEKANVSHVRSPIRRTNLILKNPNFQVATKIWDFLQSFEDPKTSNLNAGLDTTGDNLLKSILDDAFLMDFMVLDSISISKRKQKKQIAEYAVIIMKQQIKRVVSMLLNSGIDVSDEDILNIVIDELKKERAKAEIDSSEIKERFKSAIDEYLEKTQNYL